MPESPPVKKSTFKRHMLWELREFKRSLASWRFYQTLAWTALGLLIVAYAMNALVLQQQFLSGGITGISLIIFYAFEWPELSVIFLMLSIPLLFLGLREFTLRFMVIAIAGTFFFSFFLKLTAHVDPILVPDRLMGAILSGLITGAGTGLYLRVGGSAGGMDIVATVIRKRLAIPMGTTFTTINALNLLVGGWLMGLETALYSGIYMYISTVALEKVQTGFSQRRSVFIITSKPEEVAENVMKKLDRGVTFFHTTGGFSHQESRAVYSVINMVELGRLKEMLFHTDPHAFLSVQDTTEVIGRRFLTWEEAGYVNRDEDA